MTGFGAGDSRGRGGFLYSAAFHLLLGRVYDDKDVQERIVHSGTPKYAPSLRPSVLHLRARPEMGRHALAGAAGFEIGPDALVVLAVAPRHRRLARRSVTTFYVHQ